MKTILRRPAFIAAGMILILTIALTFPPVQAIAGSFLGLFRVQQIRVISFDPAAIERVDGVMQENQARVKAFFQDNLTVTREGEFVEVGSKSSAAREAGFTPRLPEAAKITTIGVEPAQTVELAINSTLMNSVLESLGQDVKIPADLDGEKISSAIPAIVTAQIGLCPSPSDATQDPDQAQYASCIRLMQFDSPTITAPDRFPVVQLGEAMLQVLGLSPDQARKFSQSIDWTTTLVIPVPTGNDVTTSDVSVDGVTGTLVSAAGQGQYTLLWVKDNRVYALTGWGDPTDGLAMANILE